MNQPGAILLASAHMSAERGVDVEEPADQRAHLLLRQPDEQRVANGRMPHRFDGDRPGSAQPRPVDADMSDVDGSVERRAQRQIGDHAATSAGMTRITASPHEKETSHGI
ncbi:hypothetical protein CH337_13065 [Rhodoblastus acidophilus]|nr:hypothetical protein CKO16_20470 [Rhodoblastus acidophilus]RAI18849.1 hypothetical protein CH337_13065 [Rhodoblastus acidophilus]